MNTEQSTDISEQEAIKRGELVKQESNIVSQDSNIVPMSSYDSFIFKAMENGNIETIERMVMLKERFEAGEAKKAFHAAMAKFQSIRPELKKTGKVNFTGKTGIVTNYNFCPLSEVEKCIKEPLFKCGLSYRYENIFKENREGLRCIVTHNLGHSESSELYAPVDVSGNKNPLQQIASRNTYLQRYTLLAVLALASADEDDDGVNSGEMPYVKLVRHNEALRSNLDVVCAIKMALKDEDYPQCVQYTHEMDRDSYMALFVAESKGGIWTAEENKILRSHEYAKVVREYANEKNTSV